MRRIKFHTFASADMRRIAKDTRARWGREQAALYSARLRNDIKSLRKFPFRFPKTPERPALRRMNSGRHSVFYLVTDEQIEIVRVLHTSMDDNDRLG